MAISYQNLLDQMRAASESEDVPVAPVPKRSSFVPSRNPAPMDTGVEDNSYNPIDLMTQWMKVIKSSGKRARDNALLQSSKQKDVAPVIIESNTNNTPPNVPPRNDRSMFAGMDPLEGISGGSVKGADIGNAKTLSDVVDATEGGGNYSTLYNNSQNNKFAGVDVSKMTIGQLKAFTRPDSPYAQYVKGEVGRVATPMGRYQIVGSTLSAAADALKLSDDTVFDASVQDAMFNHLSRQAISKGSTMQEKVTNLRREWEGLKSVPTAKLVSLIRNQG